MLLSVSFHCDFQQKVNLCDAVSVFFSLNVPGSKHDGYNVEFHYPVNLLQ